MAVTAAVRVAATGGVGWVVNIIAARAAHGNATMNVKVVVRAIVTVVRQLVWITVRAGAKLVARGGVAPTVGVIALVSALLTARVVAPLVLALVVQTAPVSVRRFVAESVATTARLAVARPAL